MGVPRLKKGRSANRTSRSRVSPGTAPGTISPSPDSARTKIDILAFSSDKFEEHTNTQLEKLKALRDKYPVVWLDVRGFNDTALLEEISKRLSLHPLALEDIVLQNGVAKIEEYEDSMRISLAAPPLAQGGEMEQVDIFFRKGILCTFQDSDIKWMDPVKGRIRSARKRIRSSGADYLAYAVLDLLTDYYLPRVEHISGQLDDLEHQIIEHVTKTASRRVTALSHELLMLKRTISPMRDLLQSLMAEDMPLVAESSLVFFRDCRSQAQQIVSTIDFERERSRGLIDLAMASVSFKTNEVVKVLTIISTIFIPLGFIAGLYGMNFDPEASSFNMPELGWRYGYPAVIGAMLAISSGLLIFFKVKGWIGSARRTKNGD